MDFHGGLPFDAKVCYSGQTYVQRSTKPCAAPLYSPLADCSNNGHWRQRDRCSGARRSYDIRPSCLLEVVHKSPVNRNVGSVEEQAKAPTLTQDCLRGMSTPPND